MAVRAVGGDLLGTIDQVALDHQTFDQTTQFVALTAGVQNVLGDTGLFEVFFCGICMVGIDDNSRVLEARLGVQLGQLAQILVVVVGAIRAVEFSVAA